MITAFWCLFVALLLPIVLSWVSGYHRAKLPGGLDNEHPREQVKLLEGVGARAYAAQQNAWEALVIFTAAVLTAQTLGVADGLAAMLAIAFIAFRVLHALCYLANLAALRSLAFIGGLIAALWLFLLGLL
jgi:uncharacterized MAPEG superfamily protein